MAVGQTGYIDVTVMPQSVGKVRVYWQEDYFAEENYSTITVTDIQGYLWHRNGYAYVRCRLDTEDVAVLPDTGSNWMFGALADTTLRSVCSAWDIHTLWTPVTSEPIYHDEDGTKTIDLTFTLIDCWMPSVGFDDTGNQVAVQRVTLTPIPRASSVTAGNGIIGSPLSVSVVKTSGSYLHTLRYGFCGREESIAERTAASLVKWTPPMELCSLLPNGESGDCTIHCDTYSGETFIGSKCVTVTLSVPAHVGLTVSEGWATASPYNTGAAAVLPNVYVQGYSAAQVTFDGEKISGESAYGSEIAGFSIRCGGAAGTSDHRTGVLTAAGDTKILCTVTDTRGRTVTQTLTVSVLPYANPTLSGIEVFRCGSDGSVIDGGTAAGVKAVCGFSSLDGHNRCVLQARYRSPKGEYGSPESVESGSLSVLWAGALSPRQTYEVQLTATDVLGNTAVCSVVIPTDDAFFHGRRGGKGAAFGKYAEEDDLLEVAWNILGKGTLTVEGNAAVGGVLSAVQLMLGELTLLDFVYPVGRIILSDRETNPAELYGGTWERIEPIGGHIAWKRVADEYTGAAADLAVADLAVCQ